MTQEPYKQSRNVNKGRVVIYRVPTPDFQGVKQERPAIIVRAWSDDMLQLAVLRDGSNDSHGPAEMVTWATSVHYSEEPKPHTWCWCDEQDMGKQAE